MRFTVSKFAKKFKSSFSNMQQVKKCVEELNRRTPEQLKEEERRFKREERALKRAAWKSWRQATEWRLLARRLGVRKIIAMQPFGHAQADYLGGDCVLRINVYQAHCEEDIIEVFAHELGHHLDWLANNKFKDSPTNKVLALAFKRAGLRASPMTHCEVIAETLGKYLCGRELNAVLLNEVRKVLAKLPRPKATLITKFRRVQIARKELAA